MPAHIIDGKALAQAVRDQIAKDAAALLALTMHGATCSAQFTNYNIFVMENGDRFFVRTTVLAQNNVNPDGSRKSVATSTGFITGGTGKLTGIQGFVRSVNVFDPKAGLNEGQTEIEYALAK